MWIEIGSLKLLGKVLSVTQTLLAGVDILGSHSLLLESEEDLTMQNRATQEETALDSSGGMIWLPGSVRFSESDAADSKAWGDRQMRRRRHLTSGLNSSSSSESSALLESSTELQSSSSQSSASSESSAQQPSSSESSAPSSPESSQLSSSCVSSTT